VAIWSYIRDTHEQVVPLYQLEKDVGFDPDNPTARTREFVIRRMAAGATMLRALWYTAWVESEALAAQED
jgi:hypothetical protein